MPKAGIEIGNQDPVLNVMIQPVFNEVHDAGQLIQAFQGKTAGLNRNNDLLGCADRVNSKDP